MGGDEGTGGGAGFLTPDGTDEAGSRQARWENENRGVGAPREEERRGAEGGSETASYLATTLSHLVWFILRSGWETKRCQMTAWKASLCGVMLAGLTVGTMTQAWATLAA